VATEKTKCGNWHFQVNEPWLWHVQCYKKSHRNVQVNNIPDVLLAAVHPFG
jgi:hypothetical protein